MSVRNIHIVIKFIAAQTYSTREAEQELLGNLVTMSVPCITMRRSKRLEYLGVYICYFCCHYFLFFTITYQSHPCGEADCSAPDQPRRRPHQDVLPGMARWC